MIRKNALTIKDAAPALSSLAEFSYGTLHPLLTHFRMSTVFLSSAKINLGLRVLERRTDGYHAIETVFHRIDMHDRLHFEPSASILVSSDSKDAPGGESNICFKAAEQVRTRLGVKDGVRIVIQKNIPVGAGLGGGSSDAATVLKELPGFWGRALPEPDLAELALALGSDVPFFLRTRSALATGRGEILQEFELPVPYFILVCYPGVHISTAWAYQQVRPGLQRASRSLRDIVLEGMSSPSILRRELLNDFEPAVFATFPLVARVKQALLHAGAVYASLSGSGSSVYGLFSDAASAEAAAKDSELTGSIVSLTPPQSPGPSTKEK